MNGRGVFFWELTGVATAWNQNFEFPLGREIRSQMISEGGVILVPIIAFFICRISFILIVATVSLWWTTCAWMDRYRRKIQTHPIAGAAIIWSRHLHQTIFDSLTPLQEWYFSHARLTAIATTNMPRSSQERQCWRTRHHCDFVNDHRRHHHRVVTTLGGGVDPLSGIDRFLCQIPIRWD